MNDRQRRFAEYYAACGNAAQAARQAGYSERTARSLGQRLLTNDDILRYVKTLQNEAAALRIATINQVRAYWSDVLNDPGEKTSDRLRAGELLAKAAGAFLHVKPGDVDNECYAVGEADGGDVVIYLPKIQDEKEVEVDDE